MATCFRHADRETGRACTRCGRPACADCLIQASVGSQCVECVRAGAPARREQARRWWRSQTLVLGWVVIAGTVAAYAVIGLLDGRFDGRGATSRDLALFGPAVEFGEWWRLLTHSIVHYGPIHLLFNMFVLYHVALVLEPAAGRLRFALLYVVSVLGGAAGALLLSPDAFTGGASGGVFGVAAAATLALHRRGVPFSQTTFGPLLLINFAFGFFIRNVSVGGHLGGLIAGLVAAELMLQAGRVRRPWLGPAGAVLVGVVAFGIAQASVA